MLFRSAVEEVNDPQPVGGLDVAVRHVGEDPALGLALFGLVVGMWEVIVFCVETVDVISNASVTGGGI
mgnify:FL=1